MQTIRIVVDLIEVENITALGEAWFWESGLDPNTILIPETGTWRAQS